jgi:hypothetical protein
MDDDEQRRKVRECMRRLRAKRKAQRAYDERWAGFSFDDICEAMHIIRSPQSSLNPHFWNACVMYEGLHPRTIK